MEAKKIILSILIGLIFVNTLSLASALKIDSVNINPGTISPGKTSEITLVIKNNGDNDLTDFSVNLDFTNLPLSPYNSASSYNIDDFESDDTKEAKFEIIADSNSKSGTYKIPVTITYIEDEQPKNFKSLISIIVNSQPIMSVDYNGGLLLKGQNNKVTFKIINKGLEDVKFLDINVGSSTYYTITSQKEIYIGDVDNNDFQTADFDIFFSANAPSIISLPVDIMYKDSQGREYKDSFTVQLKIYNMQQAQNLGLISNNNIWLTIIVIIIILIVIFFIVRGLRRRKKNSNNY